MKKYTFFIIAWVIGILVAFISLIPAISVWNQSDCLYNGGVPILNDEDDFPYYFPRVTAFSKGYYLVGDPVYWEHREDYNNTLDKTSIIITGFIHKFTENSLITFIITRLLFLPISFSIFSWIFYRLTKSKLISVIFSLFIFLSPEIFDFLSIDKNLNMITQLHYIATRYLRRFPNNLVNTTQLLLFVLLCLRVYSTKFLSRKYVYFLALLIGLMSYSYFYYWTFALVALSLLAAVIFISNKHNNQVLFSIFTGFLLTLISSSFYIYQIIMEQLDIKSNWLDIFDKTSMLGAFNTHWYTGNIRSFLRIGLFILLFFLGEKLVKKQDRNNFITIAILILSSELAFNSNLITGLAVQPDHYTYTITWILLLLFFLSISWQFISRIKYQRVIISGMLIAIILLSYEINANHSKKISSREFLYCDEPTTQLIEELSSIRLQSVVLPLTENDLLSNMILNNTKHFVFLYWTGYSQLNNAELLTRRAYVNKLTNLSFPLQPEKEMHQIINDFSYSFRFNQLLSPPNEFADLKGINYENCQPFCEMIPRVASEYYRKAFSKIDLLSPPYKLDYLVVYSKDKDTYLDGLSGSTEVYYKNEKYAILKLPSTPKH